MGLALNRSNRACAAVCGYDGRHVFQRSTGDLVRSTGLSASGRWSVLADRRDLPVVRRLLNAQHNPPALRTRRRRCSSARPYLPFANSLDMAPARCNSRCGLPSPDFSASEPVERSSFMGCRIRARCCCVRDFLVRRCPRTKLVQDRFAKVVGLRFPESSDRQHQSLARRAAQIGTESRPNLSKRSSPLGFRKPVGRNLRGTHLSRIPVTAMHRLLAQVHPFTECKHSPGDRSHFPSLRSGAFVPGCGERTNDWFSWSCLCTGRSSIRQLARRDHRTQCSGSYFRNRDIPQPSPHLVFSMRRASDTSLSNFGCNDRSATSA